MCVQNDNHGVVQCEHAVLHDMVEAGGGGVAQKSGHMLKTPSRPKVKWQGGGGV